MAVSRNQCGSVVAAIGRTFSIVESEGTFLFLRSVALVAVFLENRENVPGKVDLFRTGRGGDQEASRECKRSSRVTDERT